MVVSLRGNFFLLTVLHQRRCSSSFVLTTVARGATTPGPVEVLAADGGDLRQQAQRATICTIVSCGFYP
jgi:hypothetical protein